MCQLFSVKSKQVNTVTHELRVKIRIKTVVSCRVEKRGLILPKSQVWGGAAIKQMHNVF